MKSFFITITSSFGVDKVRLPWWTITSLSENEFKHSPTGKQTVIRTTVGENILALETPEEIERLVNEACAD
jgi:hypothetical protein